MNLTTNKYFLNNNGVCFYKILTVPKRYKEFRMIIAIGRVKGETGKTNFVIQRVMKGKKV